MLAANSVAVTWRAFPVGSAVLVAASWVVCVVSYESHGGGAAVVQWAVLVVIAVGLTAFAALFIIRGLTDRTSAIVAIPVSLLAAAAILYLGLAFGLRD